MSVAHFLGSLVMLHNFDKADFGVYSFMFIAMQFMNSISNALICAPFSVNAQNPEHSDADEKLYLQSNLALSFAGACAAFVLGLLVGPWQASLAFSVWIFSATVRWFLRNYYFAKNQPNKAFGSDLAYSLVFCAGLLLVHFGHSGLSSMGVCAAAAAIAGLLAEGKFLGKQFAAAGFSELAQYRSVWENQSRWALLGVTTTEATANAHSWLVTLLSGPAAFAPIAAASLFFKPLSLITSALAQVERPALARILTQERYDQMATRLGHLRAILMVAWGLTIVAAVAIWLFVSNHLIEPRRDFEQFLLTFVFLAGISVISSWRAPESILLQAAGEFKRLSFTSIFSGAATLVITVAALLAYGPTLALVGVLIGQLVLAYQLHSASRDWKTRNV